MIPIIDNTAKEEDLAESLADAITRSVGVVERKGGRGGDGDRGVGAEVAR